MQSLIISGVVGIALGWLGSNMTFLQGKTLIPWGLVGLGVGYFGISKKQASLNGLTYGFVLGFVFMVAIYGGSEPAVNRIPFFLLMGLVSAICGVVLGFLGYSVKERLANKL